MGPGARVVPSLRLHTRRRFHELVAVFTGKGPHWRDYRRGATLKLDKGIGAKYVELQITDKVQKQQPEFQISEWE